MKKQAVVFTACKTADLENTNREQAIVKPIATVSKIPSRTRFHAKAAIAPARVMKASGTNQAAISGKWVLML